MTVEVIQKIADYNESLSLFLTQFKDSTKLQGIMQAANNSANDIETALWEIRDNFYLDTAIGVQLDILGLVFNEDRLGRDDTAYRTALKAKASLNFSGEPESIIDILKSIYEGTYATYRPWYPARYYIESDGIILYSALNMISPAGVQGYIENFLLDGAGNYILDGAGNYITCVLSD